MVATIKHHQRCIKLSPSGINEWLYEIAKPDTLVGDRAFGYVILEQTYAVTISSVYISQIVALVRGILNDSFGSAL